MQELLKTSSIESQPKKGGVAVVVVVVIATLGSLLES